MVSSFYLLSLELCGIKNVEKPLFFEFYKRTINNDFNPDKYKVKAIYGENGSGKTAIITAVKLIKDLITDKDYLFNSNNQKFLYEIVNKNTKSGYIEISFYIKKTNRSIFRYRIDFSIDVENKRVYLVSEKLEKKSGNYSKNNYSLIYSVKEGCLTYFSKEQDLFEHYREKTLNILNQQTFISTIIYSKDLENLDKYSNKLKKTFLFNLLDFIFLYLFGIYIYVYLDEMDNHSSYFLKENLNLLDEKSIKGKEIELFNKIKNKIILPHKNENLVLKKYYESYEQRIKRMYSFIKIFKTDLLDIIIEKKDYDKDYYQCNLIMCYEQYKIDREFESRGIKKLIDIFDYIYFASAGFIVFIDELDSSINNIYLDKIIEFFILYGKGQLCFTAHNLSPMALLKENKNSIDFISSINTVHTWANNGNQSPENTYRNGFIEDSPFNVDASDFLGILGGEDE